MLKRRGFFTALAGLIAVPFVPEAAKAAKVQKLNVKLIPMIDVAGIDPAAIRDLIMPAITEALESGVKGYREKWIALLKEKP